LNISAKKKRDTMISDPRDAGQPLGPITLTGPQVIFWCPTFRPPLATGTTGLFEFAEAGRTSTTAYMLLLKEKIRIETLDDTPWQWRRIVFGAKGRVVPEATIPTTSYSKTQANSLDSSRFDVMRQTSPLTGGQAGSLLSVLMRGSIGEDWFDPITAFKDTENFKFRYDRIKTINSGNSVGCMREFTDRHWLKHNLKYNDIEVGGVEAVNTVSGFGIPGFSTIGRPGMGDTYIVDMFRPLGGNTGSQMTFLPEATLYWHEK